MNQPAQPDLACPLRDAIPFSAARGLPPRVSKMKPALCTHFAESPCRNFAAKDETRKKLLYAGELVLRFAGAPTG